jgi:PKD repeat protein
MTYELFYNSFSMGITLAGTGSALSFGMFTMPGQYSVEGTNPGGPCTRWMQDTAEVVINPIPVTDFEATTPCSGDTTWFTVTGAYINATSLWSWNFGDGSLPFTNAPVNPVAHLYETYGTYTVTLHVTDTNGCQYTVSHEVTVRQHPVSFFSISTPDCLDTPTQFTDLSTNPGEGYLQRWIWDYGDGTPKDTVNFPDSPNVTHTYATDGAYTVTLTVYNSVDCSDTWSTTVTITRAPAADFTMQATACREMDVQFQDLSEEDGGGAIVSRNWDFGDPASGVSNFSIEQNPAHSYATEGTYTVTLIVTNYHGCSDTLQKAIDVLGSRQSALISGLPAWVTARSCGPI